jgi:predicted ABC-type sugar transport system permease subunit
MSYDDAPAAAAQPSKDGFSLAKFGSAYFLLGVLVVLFVVFSLLAPNTFPTAFNLQTMGTGKSIVALLALAVMVPIAANEFDLSVGYGVGLFHILTMGLMVFNGLPWYLAVIIVIAAGGLLGLINGLLVAWAKISSFIATLGTGTVLYGLSQWYSGGLQIVSPTPLAPEFLGLTRVIFGVPWPVIFVLVIAFLMWIAAEYLPVGRYLYVTGSNRRAAECCWRASCVSVRAAWDRNSCCRRSPRHCSARPPCARDGSTSGARSPPSRCSRSVFRDFSVGLAGWVGRRTANRTSAASALVRKASPPNSDAAAANKTS